MLTLADGTLVARQPHNDRFELEARVPVELGALKGGQLIDRWISVVDGRAKLVAAVDVGVKPLMLVITRDEEQALMPWRDEMRSAAIRTLLLSALVVLTIVGLLRQMRRLEVGAIALRASEERYAMVMEAASEGHIEWHLAGGNAYPSLRWSRLHGIEPLSHAESIEELKRRIVIHPEDAVETHEAVEAHVLGLTPFIEIEYRIKAPSGEWRWIHARGRRVVDADGVPVRVFSSAIDVSDRRRAAEEKTQLESRLQQTQKLEALGTLAGGIAHDFNNILGAILGFGEMAQRRAEEGTPIRRHIDRVMQSGARARLLVRRILDFSRNSLAERVPVNLQVVVEEVIDMLTPSLPSGLTIVAHLEAGSAAVIGDSTQLYQVVMNVCTNAAQAMGDTGAVDIGLERVELVETRHLLRGELPPGPYVQLDVTDTGVGIAPDVLSRIFDPFFTTKRFGEGTGLGLSVVHGIVFDHGGAIDVQSQPGLGTRVSIWLPVVGECEPPPKADAADWPRGNGEIVMVVDDEEALLSLAEELLAELGYEPRGYGSAEKAMAAFEARPESIDVLLTDESMPGMSGTQLSATVLARRPSLPVVLMSGNVGAELEQRAREAGIRDVLRKPLALADIAEALARALHS